MFEFIGSIFDVAFYQPVFNVLMFFYRLFGNNLGLAIIAVAFIAKIVTIPITRKQIDSAKKMKAFQDKSKEVKAKYKKNKEKMNEELMKLSAEYMPAQLGGCLPLIISLILLIQVRNVVVNLVNEGYHAFNQVAYSRELEFEEDSVVYEVSEPLEEGEHTLKYEIEASDGHKLEKEYTFFVVDSNEEGEAEIEKYEDDKSDEELEEDNQIEQEERNSEIAVHVSNFEEGNFVTDDEPEIQAFIRPPSKASIDSIKVEIDGEDVTEDADISEGDEINLEFLGMNLSRVGFEFLGDWGKFTPYFILALLIGITQFATSKLQMGLSDMKNKPEKKKESGKKKKKQEKVENPDFTEIMQESSRQMVYMMPIFTVIISLGALGGASLFPAAVSLFWTVNNAFVIIQQGITNKDDIKQLFKI